MAPWLSAKPAVPVGALPNTILLAPIVALPPSCKLTLPAFLPDLVASNTTELPAFKLAPVSILSSPLALASITLDRV